MFLHRFKCISFVRGSWEAFTTVVFDAVEGKRDGCLLGEPTRRRPVRPDLARTRQHAMRRLDTTRPLYVGVLDSSGVHLPKLGPDVRLLILKSCLRVLSVGRLVEDQAFLWTPGRAFFQSLM